MPVVSGAALKGDHFDARSGQKGKGANWTEGTWGGRERGGVEIYRRLAEIDRQTQQGLFTLRESISR